ncbi:hypothetical protein BBC0244_011180 [Bartonella apihabitans]|uniref:hypothetical protein n=1 Tax=Bartonella apihabitans TaxID=2750929 RepID=UPI0009C30E38|nr:hypothetical protein [Bartonella apihabitans]AQT44825.1 hypothetical protein BBC0244_011180 [Bartonella apihabitans]
MKASDIDKKIIQLLPDTKAGFEKFGYKYAYYQLTTIYRMIVKELRREISGDDYRDSNLEFLKRTVLDTYHVQSETQKIMDESSLPKDLIQDTLTEQDKV